MKICSNILEHQFTKKKTLMGIQHKTFSGEGEGLEKNLAEGWNKQVYLYTANALELD
jgi:hypothetical protein